MSMLLLELSQLLQTLVEILPGLGTDDHGSNDVMNLVLLVVSSCGGMVQLFSLQFHFSVVMMSHVMMMAVVMMSCGGGSMCLGQGIIIVLLAGKDGGNSHGSLSGVLIHPFLSTSCVHGGSRGSG